MTTLNYVTVGETFDDGSGTAVASGTVTFTPSTSVYFAGVPVAIGGEPVTAEITGGRLQSLSGAPVQLLATDNANVVLGGRTGWWNWSVAIDIDGAPPDGWSFFLPSSPGSVDLYQTAGTGAGMQDPMTTAGDLITGGSGGTPQRLAGNASATLEVLTSTGNGTVASSPAWETLAALGVLLAANNLSDVNAAEARANLGLGSAALANTSAFDAAEAASGVLATIAAEIGAASGIASLDGSSHVPAGQLALALLLAGGTMQGFLAPRVATLTDAATVAVNAALGNALDLTPGGNRTVGVPSNPVNGQHLTFRVRQPASGGPWTVTWASGTGGYSFGSGSAPTLSTAASACDLVAFTYDSVKQQWDYLGSGTGF